jgi:hypothetical protein
MACVKGKVMDMQTNCCSFHVSHLVFALMTLPLHQISSFIHSCVVVVFGASLLTGGQFKHVVFGVLHPLQATLNIQMLNI